MKKILYIDLLSPKGHKKFNELNINALTSVFNVTIVGRKNFIDSRQSDLVIPERFFKPHKKINYRINELNKINWIIKKIKTLDKFDLMLISSYETISFSLKSRIMANVGSKVAVFNHNNLDEFNRIRINKYFFKKIDKRVVHCVFESYIKEYLLNDIKVKNSVILIPLLVENRSPSSNFDKSRINIFIPSKNYDANYINKIFNNSPKNVVFTIKSDTFFERKNIKSKTYFEDNEYNQIFNSSNFILLPLKIEYTYRVSNIIYECFSFSKPCFTFENKFSKYLNNKYPNVVHIIDKKTDIDQIIEEYKQINNILFAKERELFLKEHSEEKVLPIIKTLIN